MNLRALQGRWLALFPRTPRPAAEAALRWLVRAYGERSRHYHNLAHIADCLRELDANRDLAADARAVEIAFWFHDAVYDPTRGDNEDRSADLAADRLDDFGEDRGTIDRIRALIAATKHDGRKTPTPDERLTADIDLAGLAAPPETFDENTRLIRREYAHVPDAEFRRGRAAFFRRMLERPRIYFTDRYFERCESAARDNLRRAIATLEKPTAGAA